MAEGKDVAVRLQPLPLWRKVLRSPRLWLTHYRIWRKHEGWLVSARFALDGVRFVLTHPVGKPRS